MFLSRFFYGLSATHKLSSSVEHELSYLWFPVERGGDHETDRDTTGGQEDEISRSIRDMARETLEKHWKSWKRVGKEWKRIYFLLLFTSHSSFSFEGLPCFLNSTRLPTFFATSSTNRLLPVSCPL